MILIIKSKNPENKIGTWTIEVEKPWRQGH